jgi:hypothetical protein
VRAHARARLSTKPKRNAPCVVRLRHWRHMAAPATNTALPSAETLAQAARQVGDAYPGLYAHQRAGVAFLLSRRRAILADDMGLGKGAARPSLPSAKQTRPVRT